MIHSPSALDLFNPEREPSFDRLTRIASELTGASRAALTFVNQHQHVVKSATGWPSGINELHDVPRTHCLCREAVTTGRPMLVEDARVDYANNGAVREWGVVAYAAVPIPADDAGSTAVLSLAHDAPRRWDPAMLAALGELVSAIVRQASLRREIAERERREAEFRQHATFSRVLLDSAHEGVCMVDTVGRITYSNPRLGSMLGYESETLVGRSLFELMDPETAFEARTQFARRQRGIAETRERGLLRADGALVWTNESVSPFYDPSGDFAGALFLLSDLTERRRAEAALRESEARFRALIENASEVIAVLDAKGITRYVSNGVERLSGYRADEIVGTSGFVARVHPDDSAMTREALAQVLQEPSRPVRLQFRYRHRKDGWLQLSCVATNLLDDPAVRGIVLNVHDVTAQRTLEEQLHQSQKMEAVGRLAGGVAHDFNNLLTVIEAHSGLLAEDLPSQDPLLEHVREISRAAQRAAGLTRQLLAFSRHQVMRPRRLDLNRTVADVQTMLARLIGEDVTLEVRLTNEPAIVEADAGQLGQVLMNLAVNARDAMPTGGRLEILTSHVHVGQDDHRHRAVPPGEYVSLAVRDSGTGMDEATRSLIFEPFFTTKPHGKGTGLGLSTVYGIVQKSGGYIGVESQLGVGTTFEVLLPSVDPGSRAPSNEQSAQPARGGDETILLCEDEDGVRNVARRFLIRHGYHVLEARNGDEALRIADEFDGKIDLLVTDAVMPQMGGGELAEALVKRRPETKVLFVSGYTEDRLVHHAAAREGTSFLEKPFTGDELAMRVRELLDA